MVLLSGMSACGHRMVGWSDGDIEAPTVSSSSPSNGETDTALDAAIRATFSEAMAPATVDETTFTLETEGARVMGTVSYTGVTVRFTPTAQLEPDTEYKATIVDAVTDLAGNALAEDYVFRFTTVSAPVVVDDTRPRVTETIPGADATAVSVNAAVVASFSEAMDPGTLDAATFTLKNGTVSIDGAVDRAGATATFDPAVALDPGIRYTATITTGATDLAGNALAQDYVWRFTTGPISDASPPTVSFTNPADEAVDLSIGTTVRAVFSEAMAPLSVTEATFELTGPGVAAVSGSVVYEPSDHSGTFTPDAPLLLDTTYTATITTGATDLADNALVQDYAWTFSTRSAFDDGVAPTVELTDPLDTATDVPIDTVVEAAFSEPMDPATLLLATTFEVTDPADVVVPGMVLYDALRLTATFTPDMELLEDTTYTATITTAATDLAGNPLAQDYTWSFTTPVPLILPPVELRSLDSFVAAAGGGLTNSNSSGVTILNGDVALSPTATCLGDGSPCSLANPIINGTLYANDPEGVAAQAKTDLTAAYVDAMSRPPGTTVNDLSGMVLPPGVYTSGSTMSIAVDSTVTLDAQDDANAVWVFQIGSSLTVNNDALVLLINGARAKNVFWAVGASSTLGSNVSFQGSILAEASNSVGTDSVVVGRLLCTTGQITLLSSNIILPPL
jgi:hypothetical protein